MMAQIVALSCTIVVLVLTIVLWGKNQKRWREKTIAAKYVAEQGVNWYEHTLTTEQVDFSETLTAISTPRAGETRRKSEDRENMMIVSSYYANADYAAQLLATNSFRKEYHTGSIKYYANGSVKHTVNFNSFGELYSIPGL